MPPTQTLLGHVGAMLALFFALGLVLGVFALLAAFVVLFGRFFKQEAFYVMCDLHTI